jgi:hypothetical protein
LPALTVVAPLTVRVRSAVCVTLPLAALVLTARLAALTLSRAIPPALFSVRLTAPPVAPKLPRAFAAPRVTAPLPALIVVAPVMFSAAAWVTAPLPALVSTTRLGALIASRTIALPALTLTAARGRAEAAEVVAQAGQRHGTAAVVLIVVGPVTTSGALCVTGRGGLGRGNVRWVAFVAARTTPLALASVIPTVPPCRRCCSGCWPDSSVTVPDPAVKVVAPVALMTAPADSMIAAFVR